MVWRETQTPAAGILGVWVCLRVRGCGNVCMCGCVCVCEGVEMSVCVGVSTCVGVCEKSTFRSDR